jgi:preprotein translocase subunit SecG
MMSLLLGFLTVLLVLNCIVLILLVLIQLPKKEAGMGMAFGAGATEALFGAGSGNVLTKVTKYSAGIFLGLSLVLSVANAHVRRSSKLEISDELSKRAGTPAAAPAATNSPVPATGGSTVTSAVTPVLLSSTNAPAPTAPATPAQQP